MEKITNGHGAQNHRRVCTAPASVLLGSGLSDPPKPLDVESLVNLPDVRIVAFTAAGLHGGNRDPETLQPFSKNERLIAVGPFSVYRAPGSVAFLQCGSLRRPLLPKSQCWSICDHNTKFVLQIQRPTFWRIETLPSISTDLGSDPDLGVIFRQVLQFERTRCPFERPFTLALPEEPITPTRKKPWVPTKLAFPVDYTQTPETSLPPVRLLGNARPNRVGDQPRRASLCTPTKLRDTEEFSRSLTLTPRTPVKQKRQHRTVLETESEPSLALELCGIDQAGSQADLRLLDITMTATTTKQKNRARELSPSPPEGILWDRQSQPGFCSLLLWHLSYLVGMVIAASKTSLQGFLDKITCSVFTTLLTAPTSRALAHREETGSVVVESEGSDSDWDDIWLDVTDAGAPRFEEAMEGSSRNTRKTPNDFFGDHVPKLGD